MSPYEEDVLPLNYTARAPLVEDAVLTCEHTLDILTTSHNANDLIVTRSADGT